MPKKKNSMKIRETRFSNALPLKILPIKLFYGDRGPCHASHIFAAKNDFLDGEMTVTTEMTFTSGVTSSNFDTIKDDLKEAIATALGINSSMIELTLKSSITRSNSTVVVVTITSTDEYVVAGVEAAIESSSFVSTVNTEISNSATLFSAGGTLDRVTDLTVEGLQGQ